MGMISKTFQSHFMLMMMMILSPSRGINITDLVFGGNTNYLPAAFGDFNSDKLTDLFVVTEDRKTVKVLMSHNEPPLLREPGAGEGPVCTYKKLDIRSIVPGDFDGNGAMDVLLVSYNPSIVHLYQVFVLWGNLPNMTLDCGSENAPLLNLSGQPLVMDVNGDMIPDLFGENETSNRTFWLFGPDRKPPKPEQIIGNSLPRLKHPSSHAFIDLNNDLAADLWVTTDERFEIWNTVNGSFVMVNKTVRPLTDMMIVGQTSFADVNLDGNIEALLPVCKDKDCKKSSVFVFDFENSSWSELNVSFKDPAGYMWGYPSESVRYSYTDTITLRVGDFNLDGYPDFLVTLVDKDEKAQVILMENVKCEDGSCNYPRKFAPKWNLFKDFGETVLGTFCDFQEDGTLDVLLVRKAADGKYHLSVYKDASDYDAVFIKELIISPEECSPVVMFARSFIHPPRGPSPFDVGIDVKNLVEHAERTTGHALMLDSTLSPTQRAISEQDPRNNRNTSPAMPGGDPNHMGYRRGAWSPFGVGVQGRCVLILVTHDHRLSIVGREGRQWKELGDLSAHWHNYISCNSWAVIPVSEEAPLHEKYISRMRMLAISEIQWTSIYEDSEGRFSVLILLTASGHAVFWRVPTNLTGLEGIKILCVKETQIPHISAVHWCNSMDGSGYLVVGSGDGQVKIFYCQFIKNSVLLRDLGNTCDSNDRLRVNHIHLSHVCDDQYVLLLAKHNIMLATTINLAVDNLTVKCTAYSHIGKLAISGIVVLESWNVYVSIKDGTIQHIFIDISQDGNLSVKELGAVFHSEGVSYTGLMTSPNKTLWGILESVSVAYDHLVVREPTQISIYQVGDAAEMTRYMLESSAPLHRSADLLESLRISVCKDGWSPLTMIEATQISKQPLQLLKVHYWLAKMSRNIGFSGHNAQETLEDVESKLQKAILEHWIVDTLRKFINIEVPKESSILLSLALMCKWIKENGREKDKDVAKFLLHKLGQVNKELCLVCKEAVQLDSITFGRCENGHTLPRCCRSLLLTKPTISCPRCRVFLHKDATYFETKLASTCTYCDGFVISELNGRNMPHHEVKRTASKAFLTLSSRQSRKIHSSARYSC